MAPKKQLFQFLEILTIALVISRDDFRVHNFQNSFMMVASLALAGGILIDFGFVCGLLATDMFQCLHVLYMAKVW